MISTFQRVKSKNKRKYPPFKFVCSISIPERIQSFFINFKKYKSNFKSKSAKKNFN